MVSPDVHISIQRSTKLTHYAAQEEDDFDSIGSTVDEDLLTKSHKTPIEVKTARKKDKHSYDEDLDGESSPTVVGSADASHTRKDDSDEL